VSEDELMNMVFWEMMTRTTMEVSTMLNLQHLCSRCFLGTFFLSPCSSMNLAATNQSHCILQFSRKKERFTCRITLPWFLLGDKRRSIWGRYFVCLYKQLSSRIISGLFTSGNKVISILKSNQIQIQFYHIWKIHYM
jgi:hypothetical protein